MVQGRLENAQPPRPLLVTHTDTAGHCPDSRRVLPERCFGVANALSGLQLLFKSSPRCWKCHSAPVPAPPTSCPCAAGETIATQHPSDHSSLPLPGPEGSPLSERHESHQAVPAPSGCGLLGGGAPASVFPPLELPFPPVRLPSLSRWITPLAHYAAPTSLSPTRAARSPLLIPRCRCLHASPLTCVSPEPGRPPVSPGPSTVM